MPRADTRTRLVVTAARWIEEGGEGSINVQKVASEAGVTVPSIYHFFGSRDGLVEEAQVYRFEEGLRQVGVSFDEVLAGVTSKSKYRDIIRLWLQSITGSRNSTFRKTRASVIGSALHNPKLAARIVEIQHSHVKRIADYLTYGISRGWIDDDLDIESIIMWTNTQLNGRVLIEIDPKKRYIKEWDALFVESVLHALRFR